MYTIVAVIIASVLLFITLKATRKSFGGELPEILFLFYVGGGSLVGLFASHVIGTFAPLHWEVIAKRELVSLSNETHVAGSFLRFGPETGYHYWYKVDGGGVRDDTLEADMKPLIIQEDREDGEYTLNRTSCEGWALYNWSICGGDKEHFFRVPNGTVVEEYSLN